MEELLLTEKVSIKPENFSSDIINLLSEKLVNRSCNEKYGYILDVIKILSYKSLLSRTTGNNIYTVQFKANTLRPKIDKEINCIVIMILPNGILAEFLDIKFLIPASELADYEYKKSMFL